MNVDRDTEYVKRIKKVQYNYKLSNHHLGTCGVQ
jgi:hypothetical protein